MPEQNQDKPIDLGLYGKGDGRAPLNVTEAAAVALSVVWVIAVVVYVLVSPAGAGTPGLVMSLLVVKDNASCPKPSPSGSPKTITKRSRSTRSRITGRSRMP